ncbi:MAG: shikimate dehydrogenase [Pseudorhodobacter sp.]|nr:shikimate dehydrogenase [Rhizobacter sp.]
MRVNRLSDEASLTTRDHYVVAGNPVQHSQSPFIHARFAEQTGEQLSYDRLLCTAEGFEKSVREFAQSGGRGCNITMPFKFNAWRMASSVSERAALAQACNVLRFDEPGAWYADNTDGVGLVRDIQNNARRLLAGTRVLMLGAGGAAAGALGPLLSAGPAELVLANRSVDKAQALVDRHAAFAAAHGVELRAANLLDCGESFDVVINATASSLGDAPVPVSSRVLKAGALALDMAYGSSALHYLAWAHQHGATGRDGLGMLVEQAAEAFFVWRGVRPDTAPVLAALLQRVAAANTK